MITAAEARKFNEYYDDRILTVLEERIKNAATKGERSISIDFSVGKYVDKLRSLGYVIETDEIDFIIKW